jgi:hypothetical protein
MRAEWIRRPQAGTSAVFVHGILSSGEACWRHDNGTYWPALLQNEPALKLLGIYVFTYQTEIFSGSYRLGDIVDALKEHMRLDGVLQSERLIFVCHSMGGMVVRKFLVERATELIEGEREIGLFLVASPSLGSSYADWLSPLARLFGHAQVDALRFVRGNEWLQDLDKEFTNLKAAGKLKIQGKELVEDKFVAFKKLWHRQVVEPFSGAKYFGEPFKVPGSDHFSIAKPADNGALQHRLLCQFVQDMLQPSTQFFSGEKPFEKRGLKFVRIVAYQEDAHWKSYESSTYGLKGDRYPARGYLKRSSVFFRLIGRFDNDPNPSMDIILRNHSASSQILLSYGIEVMAARFRVISAGSAERITLEETEHYKIQFPYPKSLRGRNAYDDMIKTIAVAPGSYRGIGSYAIGDPDSPDAVLFWEWEWADTPVISINAIHDPLDLKSGATYRFRLEIENAERMPTDTLLRVLIKTDSGEFKSDSIYFLKP